MCKTQIRRRKAYRFWFWIVAGIYNRNPNKLNQPKIRPPKPLSKAYLRQAYKRVRVMIEKHEEASAINQTRTK